MYFSYDRLVGEGVYGGWGWYGWLMGDGMLAGREDLKWRGFNFAKEIPSNEISEKLKILLKKSNVVSLLNQVHYW